MTRDCLLIMNPRRIPDCLASLEALPIDRVWLTGYTEVELCDVIAGVVAESEYENYIAVSDDGIVPRQALRSVQGWLHAGYPVVTGYSNLSLEDWRVNLCKTPLRTPAPEPAAYDLYTYQEVVSAKGAHVPTHFAGMCLTGMSREMWQRFPFDCFGRGEHAGNASDFKLSARLTAAAVPIVAPRDAFVLHVKERWNEPDRADDKQMYVGRCEPEARWDYHS